MIDVAPIAMIAVGVPLKYRWWNVPGIPPMRNRALDATTAPPARAERVAARCSGNAR